MSLEDKFDNAVEREVTGDKEREAEGKAQGVLGKAKDAITDVKDNAKDTVKGMKNDSEK